MRFDQQSRTTGENVLCAGKYVELGAFDVDLHEVWKAMLSGNLVERGLRNGDAAAVADDAVRESVPREYELHGRGFSADGRFDHLDLHGVEPHVRAQPRRICGGGLDG